MRHVINQVILLFVNTLNLRLWVKYSPVFSNKLVISRKPVSAHGLQGTSRIKGGGWEKMGAWKINIGYGGVCDNEYRVRGVCENFSKPIFFLFKHINHRHFLALEIVVKLKLARMGHCILHRSAERQPSAVLIILKYLWPNIFHVIDKKYMCIMNNPESSLY